MRIMIVPFCVALGVALASAGTSHADGGHGPSGSRTTGAGATTGATNDELRFGGGARALRSASANALTGDNLAGTSLGYARDLGVAVLPGVALWLDAGATFGEATGRMFQTVTTDLATTGFTAGLRARFALRRRIAASASLDVGMQRARVELATAGTTASDHGWGAMTRAVAALDLLAIATPRFGLGVRFELGHVLAQPVSLTPRRATGDGVIELPMAAFALGGLDLGGPAFDVSVIAQF
jgi:hypothetical protein